MLLTSAANAREAGRCRDAFGCPVLLSPLARERAGLSGAETIEPDSTLPAGVLALPLLDQDEPGETAFYHAPSASLITGAALASADAGQLRLRAAVPAAEAASDRAPDRADIGRATGRSIPAR